MAFQAKQTRRHEAICRTSVSNRTLRRLFIAWMMLLTSCTEKTSGFTAAYNEDIEYLIKKIYIVYYEMDDALNNFQVNPHSEHAHNALKLSNFQNELIDIIAGSEVLVIRSCTDPNDRDLCVAARGLLTDLLKFDADLESEGVVGTGQPTLEISLKQMLDRLEFMLRLLMRAS